MKMNRRNVLIGIGTVAVGSGAALGSGAFTQVNAERTVDVGVAGDDAAYLALVAEAGTSAVQNSGSNNTLEIDLSGGSSADGVNDDAETFIGQVSTSGGTVDGVTSAAFTVTNNSQNTIDLSLSVDGNADLIEFHAEDTSGTIRELIAEGYTGLGSTESLDVAVKVDTTGNASGADGDDDTGASVNNVTFTADIQ